MKTIRNFLFIMCDQLRRDHLSCYGHPYLQTSNIDALASRGVRFDHAYVTSGVCTPSRMSFYTGRTMTSHGATWNRVPLSVGEVALGEYLARHGRSIALAGKTHVVTDERGLERMRMARNSVLGKRLAVGYFHELDRYDGHHEPGAESGYPDFLRGHGYSSDTPWSDYVISVEDEAGATHSGWKMRNVHLPSRVAEPHSETAYMTNQAIRYIKRQGDKPWVLHLSYVKPHWPYVAPSPYHAMYRRDQCLPLARSQSEMEHPHPVLKAYFSHEECVNFQREEVSAQVRPVYQGLIKQVDDHLGRLLESLDRLGRLDDTLIIFTADHGDFLGDHWLGEKEIFFDTVQRVPMIVFDPTEAADATRGSVERRFVSAVDIVPTALAALGLPGCDERIEGKSLLSLLRGEDVPEWRDFVVSELDYSYRKARLVLGRQPDECRGWMVREKRWKYVHWQGYRPQLFDLENDPQEFVDLGDHPTYQGQCERLHKRLLEWHENLKSRETVDARCVEADTDAAKQWGVFLGEW